jgi:hypothetical protein
VLIAAAVVASMVVVGAAVGALTGGRATTADLLDTGERIDLPGAVDREPRVAWRRPIEVTSLIGVGEVVVAAGRDGVSGYSARSGERRWWLPAGRDGLPGVSRLGGDRLLLSYGPADHGEGGLRAVVVDAADGRVRGRFRDSHAEFATPLAGHDVAVLSSYRIPHGAVGVTVLSADHGTGRWTTPGYPFATDGDTVYVVDDRRLVAVDLDHGRRRWTRDISRDDRAENRGAVSIGGTVVLTRSDTTVVGLSAEDGSFRWSHRLQRPVNALRSAGGFVVATGGSEAVGLDPASGHELWQARADAWRGFPYLRIEGHDGIYALGRSVTRLDPRTGRVLAATADPAIDYYLDASAVADGLLYVPRSRQQLDALDAETLQRRWSIELDGARAALAAADDTLVVSTGDELVAYR